MTPNATGLFVTLDISGCVSRRVRLLTDGGYAARVPLTAPARMPRKRKKGRQVRLTLHKNVDRTINRDA